MKYKYKINWDRWYFMMRELMIDKNIKIVLKKKKWTKDSKINQRINFMFVRLNDEMIKCVCIYVYMYQD